MKISLNWLKEYLNIKEDPKEISKILTDIGLEVINSSKFNFFDDNLIIGRISSYKNHPNASKLKVTTVDIGGKKLNIVCGAPNVSNNMKVVVAPVNTKLVFFDGTEIKIKKSKIRGEVSEGMLCAPDEIGLYNEHDKIIELTTDFPEGTSLKKLYEVPEDIIYDIDITPNRTDALSHVGVARDLAARLDKRIIYPTFKKSINFDTTDHESNLEIDLHNPESCIRYTGILLKNVLVKESPIWLKNRIKSIGLRPINNIVDISNFILNEIGQPLHTYDYDCIEKGKIYIEKINKEKIFETIDNQKKTLGNGELVIRDEKNILCLAGIIGGKNSSVSNKTKNIFLESAVFSTDTINRTVKNLNLNTDSSYRFQRGVDPNMSLTALKRAVSLILELAGGDINSKIYDIYLKKIENELIEIKLKNIKKVLGQEIPKNEIKKICNNLEIEVQSESEDILKVSVPTYRKDVKREIDIIEEILRIYSYDRIIVNDILESQYFSCNSIENYKNNFEVNIKKILYNKGFFEIYTNSLVNASYRDLDSSIKIENQIMIYNPLSENTNSLRHSLLFSGLNIISDNIKRQNNDLNFFELGYEYYQINNKYLQEPKLALFTTELNNKFYKNSNALFQKTNSIIHEILYVLGIDKIKKTSSIEDANILELRVQEKIIGRIGYVQKSILEYFKINQSVIYAYLNWNDILKFKSEKIYFEELSNFPYVTRDLSLILDKKITFEKIKDTIDEVPQKKIIKFYLVDKFESDKLGNNKKTYTIRFILQDKKGTMKFKVIDSIMNKIIANFENKLSATINRE